MVLQLDQIYIVWIYFSPYILWVFYSSKTFVSVVNGELY